MSQPTNPASGHAPSPGDSAAGHAASTFAQTVAGMLKNYTPNANTTVLGSSIIRKLPDEELGALTKMDFQVLLAGDKSELKSGRDLCLGFLISGLLGLGSLATTVDWVVVFTKNEWGTALWAVLMLLVVGASASGAFIYGREARRASTDSPYSSLIYRLKKHFGIIPEADPQNSATPHHVNPSPQTKPLTPP
jgi:hypothetical protein